MNTEMVTAKLTLRKHQFGRIDKRMRIGPVAWPFHDLLWIHEGQVVVNFPDLPDLDVEVTLAAPAGVLILPGTRFSGHTTGAFATASVCHFDYDGPGDKAFMAPGYKLVSSGENIHLQNLVRLAMFLARRDDLRDLGRRQRLLHAILDGFQFARHRDVALASGSFDRLTAAWELAEKNLHDMRTLSDVAALIGINESAFRSLHRNSWRTPAGAHLRELRLHRAEELLATTGFTLSGIALQVGYRHAESFSAAFRLSRGMTPGEYRGWSKPFA